MDDLLMRSRMSLPITTGISPVPSQPLRQKTQSGAVSFQQVLEESGKKQGLSFSKHAAGRVAQREIELSQTGLDRLNEGLHIARDLGRVVALILMDGSAFIISPKNARVITALNSRELQGKAITNIDGTVII